MKKITKIAKNEVKSIFWDKNYGMVYELKSGELMAVLTYHDASGVVSGIEWIVIEDKK